MRLQHVCLSQPLPFNFRSHISIWHPGYIRGEDTMFSLPCLDEVGPEDVADDEVVDGNRKVGLAQAGYGVHFGTMLLACQVITGNSFDTAYLSYDRKGNNKVRMNARGILTHDHYFLHVPQSKRNFVSSLIPVPSASGSFICLPSSRAGDRDTTPYAVTPNFENWRFPEALPSSWHSIAITPRDSKPSCIISGRMATEKAHVIPQSQDKWYTNNAMSDYSQGAESVHNSVDNMIRLRADPSRILHDCAFALVPKSDTNGRERIVVHFFSTTNGAGDAAFWHHNQKVHNLASVAPQFLFARFALTVFARIKDLILRGECRQIAVVLGGIDSSGSPAWVTREVEMDRAQRLSRYGPLTSHKRARPQCCESQQDDDQKSPEGVRMFGYGLGEPEDYTSRTRAWLGADETRSISEFSSDGSLDLRYC
ncbi:hypothetical protein BBAD15_g2491 [Beauveria bassiana D1-5]|uniref:HNH nuclease domain-containing protein n=1 Tax=Beauveria bassiana D1-5 TaxID=1245745 RepID=A0A0A2VVY6_BEABA|nr:hypothetical protein BBAD15_g2491 [Beauveria bassiana D1-5]